MKNAKVESRKENRDVAKVAQGLPVRSGVKAGDREVDPRKKSGWGAGA